MREDDARPAPIAWALARPTFLVLCAYVLLAVIFFWPGFLPGHTVSAADYLWNAAPWDTARPSGVPTQSLHPLVFGSNPQLVDSITVFEPFLQYSASQLPHIPLWNPYIMGGAPYLADMQSALLSPFSLPAYILPFWLSLSVIALLKVVVAAMGAYLLGRTLKMGTAGAFLCGLVFGFGLFMVAWIPWPLTSVFALIPWMLVATERLIRRPGVLSASAVAALVALQFFGGHPETSVYALFATVGYFILRVLQEPGGGASAMEGASRRGRSRLGALFKAARRPVIAIVIAIVVGTAIAAVAILPFLELLKNSADLTTRPRSQVHVQAKYFFSAFLPQYFPSGFVIETGFYAGALPLMLAVIALFRRRVERVVIAVVGALTIAVVLGIQPFFYIAGHIPGLDQTYLSRLTIVYLLCVALLVGWGIDDVIRGRVRGRRARAGLVVAIGILVLPPFVVAATGGTSTRFLGRAVHIAWLFASAPLLNTPNVDPIYRLTALFAWITVAAVAVVLLSLVLRRRIGPTVFAALAIALVVGDLFQAGMGYNPAIPESHAVQPVTPAIRYLQRQRPARYVGVTPYAGINPLPPDVNMRYGLYDLRGYDLPVVSRFGNLWQRYVAPPTPLLPLDTPSVPLTLDNGLKPDTMRVLSLFGVRDVLEDIHGPLLQVPGLRLVYNGPDAMIYANDDSLPRTWLVAGQDVVKGDSQALAKIVSSDFDPRRAVVTESPLPALSDHNASGAAPGDARITHYGAERVEISARANRAAELVLSDTAYPGWQVTVNGRPAQITRVDYLLRGVAVPAGDDRIVFTYDPTSFRNGWLVSLVAVVVTVTAIVITVRQRRWRSRGRHARSATPAGKPLRTNPPVPNEPTRSSALSSRSPPKG
jgi:hypothetical protein